MTGAIPPLIQYSFMAWCSVKAQGQLDGGELSVYTPAALTALKMTPVSMARRMCGHHSRCGHVGGQDRGPATSGDRSPVVSPIEL
jgi:hypothetical protein